MTVLAFCNATLFDGVSEELTADATVVVEDGLIVEVSQDGAPGSAERIDCRGRFLMPGLIDLHVHVYAMDVNLIANDLRPMTLLAHRAHAMLARALARGFTTVRDCGGADHGLALALREGWIEGPRLFYCGRMISQSGGHGDFRRPFDHDATGFSWCCGHGAGHISTTADGEVEVRRAVRENLRRGASFIKFAASGGVTSIAGSVNAAQMSDAEITAIVDEVRRAGLYCSAHVHPDGAARRAIELGVHCLEHASMIHEETARLASARGVSIVPTLAVLDAIAEEGAGLGYAPESLEKLKPVRAAARDGLEALRRAGVRVGFGTDLLGPLEARQGREFLARADVFTPLELLRQATSVNATILGLGDELGRVAPGARADLLVIDGDPLRDLSVLDRQGEPMDVILIDGRFAKRRL